MSISTVACMLSVALALIGDELDVDHVCSAQFTPLKSRPMNALFTTISVPLSCYPAEICGGDC